MGPPEEPEAYRETKLAPGQDSLANLCLGSFFGLDPVTILA